MKLDDARRLVEAARAKAAELGKPMSIAVVDTAGALVFFERHSGAAPHTAAFAEGKAVASAYTGRDSIRLAYMTQTPALANTLTERLNGRFLPVQGGIVLRDSAGEIAGAIGVSGASVDEDELIARTAAESWQAGG